MKTAAFQIEQNSSCQFYDKTGEVLTLIEYREQIMARVARMTGSELLGACINKIELVEEDHKEADQ